MVGGSAGLTQFVTKNYSASLDNIGFTEIDQNSPKFGGQGTLGTGVTTAFIHCAGTYPTVKK